MAVGSFCSNPNCGKYFSLSKRQQGVIQTGRTQIKLFCSKKCFDDFRKRKMGEKLCPDCSGEKL